MSEPRTVTSSDLTRLADSLQPHFTSNQVDPMLYRLAFWTEAERIAKRERGELTTVVTSEYLSDDESSYPIGAKKLVAGNALELMVNISKPRETFDRDAFIDLVVQHCNIERHVLVGLAVQAMKTGNRIKTFKVHTIGTGEKR